MKDKREMMAQLARQLNEPEIPAEAAEESQPIEKPERSKARKPALRLSRKAASKTEASAQTQTLEKMTVKLEPIVRKRILAESFRRKSEGARNWQIQEIVSEAVNKHLGNG